MPDDRSVAESTSTWGVVNVDPADVANPTEDLKVPSSKLPWAISMYIPFDFRANKLVVLIDCSAFESGGLTISCTVLYPEQFDALQHGLPADAYFLNDQIKPSPAPCTPLDLASFQAIDEKGVELPIEPALMSEGHMRANVR